MGSEKQIALVTGASSGIGRETAIKLAGEGFQIIAVARRRERLLELANQIQGINPKEMDLSKPEDVEKLCTEILALKEPITVLINNAGYSVRGGLEDVSMEAVRRIFQVNLFSMMRITQACLPGMRKLRKGTIINISSAVGKFTFPLGGVYASTKHAVEAITDALRMEVRPFGIRAVAIRPGVIGTEFNEAANQITGDLFARTDPDYKSLYEASALSLGTFFSSISIPGPDIVADTILEAVLSDSPKAVYCAGPIVEEFLEKRSQLNDDEFDRFMAEKTGLFDLRV
ncbi:MAG: SDR family NAD(P)-dependent oxidoreductase [Thermodesulfobacteriota bacterium]|nr:SDR family NAD(P)-dependent oxidoreductase [Thermodesulfobacteriota bacterium]